MSDCTRKQTFCQRCGYRNCMEAPPMTDTEQGGVEKVALVTRMIHECLGFNILTDDLVRVSRLSREIIAALKASPPEGWVMVPVEPTEGMAFAGGEQLVQQYCDNRQWDAAKDAIEGIDATEVYRAMLSASPVKASALVGETENDLLMLRARADRLQDSAWKAGAKFGWNCAVGGADEKYQQAIEAHCQPGHRAAIAEAEGALRSRAALSPAPLQGDQLAKHCQMCGAGKGLGFRCTMCGALSATGEE